MLTVRDIMTANPVTIHPESSLKAAVDAMRTVDCRQLPVVEGGRVIGIITERDVRLAIHAPNEDMEFTQHQELTQFAVGEFMTSDPKFVGPAMSVADVAEMLRRMKVGALPVVENKELIGIISISDCLACLSDQLEEFPALLLA